MLKIPGRKDHALIYGIGCAVGGREPFSEALQVTTGLLFFRIFGHLMSISLHTIDDGLLNPRASAVSPASVAPVNNEAANVPTLILTTFCQDLETREYCASCRDLHHS